MPLYMSMSIALFLNETIIVQIASPVTLTAVLNMSMIWSIPKSMAIASTGNPTELNTIFKVMIPTEGTPAVPIEAITAVKITVIRAEIPKSIPYACAANITAHPCMIAVPSMFIVAPNGIVNEDISLDTPISDNFSKFNGIVAFDVEDENAKIITDMNLLKNGIGFSLVKIVIKDG